MVGAAVDWGTAIAQEIVSPGTVREAQARGLNLEDFRDR
jgi:hypothetical protein